FAIVLVLAAALLMLVPSAHAALEDAEQLLRRLSAQGTLPASRSMNVAAVTAVLITFASGAQVSWLSRAYGMSIAAALLLKVATILRLRATRRESPPFSIPFNI